MVLTQKVPQIHGNTVELLPAASMCLLDSKNVRTTPTSSQQHTSVVANVPQVGYFERLLLKYKILDVQKYVSKTVAILIATLTYESDLTAAVMKNYY